MFENSILTIHAVDKTAFLTKDIEKHDINAKVCKFLADGLNRELET